MRPIASPGKTRPTRRRCKSRRRTVARTAPISSRESRPWRNVRLSRPARAPPEIAAGRIERIDRVVEHDWRVMPAVSDGSPSPPDWMSIEHGRHVAATLSGAAYRRFARRFPVRCSPHHPFGRDYLPSESFPRRITPPAKLKGPVTTDGGGWPTPVQVPYCSRATSSSTDRNKLLAGVAVRRRQ